MSEPNDPKGQTPSNENKDAKPRPLDLPSAMALMAEQSDMLDDSELASLGAPKSVPPPVLSADELPALNALEEGVLSDWEVPENSSPVLVALSENDEPRGVPVDLDELPPEDVMTGSVYDPELQQLLASGRFDPPPPPPAPSLGLAEPQIEWPEEKPPEEEEDEFSLAAVEQALAGVAEERAPEPPPFLPPTAVEVPSQPLQALEDFQPPPLVESPFKPNLPVRSPSKPPEIAPPPEVAPAPVVLEQPQEPPVLEVPVSEDLILESPVLAEAPSVSPPPFVPVEEPPALPLPPLAQPEPEPVPVAAVPPLPQEPAPVQLIQKAPTPFPQKAPTPPPLEAPRPTEAPKPPPPSLARFGAPAAPEIDPIEAMLASIENRGAQRASVPLPMPGGPRADDAASMFDDVQGTQVLTMDEIVEVIEPVPVATPQRVPSTPPKAPPLPPRLPPRPPAIAKPATLPFTPWVKASLPSLESIPQERERRWLSIFSAEANAREAERGALLYEAGEMYETTLGDPNAALACYKASLELSPELEPARHGVMRLLAREENTSAIEEQLKEATARVQGRAKAWLEVEHAILLENKKKDPEAAKACYEAAHAADPENLTALMALARLAQPQNDPVELEPLWDKISAAVRDPRWRAAWLILLAHLRASKRGDFLGAEAALKEALLSDPRANGVLVSLQRLFARQENHIDLLLALNQEAESANSVDAAALLRAAVVLSLYQRGDADAAWLSLEQALAHTPNDTSLLTLAVQVAQQCGRGPSAEELLRRLISLTVDASARQALSLELALSKLRDPSGTLDEASRQALFVQTSGDFAEESLRILGRLLRRSNQKALEQALLLEKRSQAQAAPEEAAELDLWLGRLSSDVNEAKLHLQGALSSTKEPFDAALSLADIGRDQTDPTLEYEALSAAAQHASDGEEALLLGLRRAWIARFLLKDPGKYADALSSLASKGVVSARDFARALEAAGRFAEAAQVLHEALSANPDLSAELSYASAVQLARLREILGEVQDARALYLSLEQIRPGDLASILGLERTRAEPGRIAAAYERACQHDEALILPLLHRAAALYLEGGHFSEAARLYEGLSQYPEGGATAAVGLLAARRALKDDAALQQTLALLSQRADEIGMLTALELGARLEGAGHPEQATSLYDKVLSGPAPLAEAARYLALSLACRQNRWLDAETYAAPLLVAKEEAGQGQRRSLRLTLARAFETTHPDKARAYYQEILQENPADLVALRGAQRCAIAMQDKLGAAELSSQLAQHGPLALAAVERLKAVRFLEEAKKEGSGEQLALALSQVRTDPTILFALEARRGRGVVRSDLRVAYEARLSQASPDERPAYMLRLGELEAEAGRASQGLPILEVAKDRAPNDLATLLSARRVARQAENRASFLRLSEALVGQLHEPKQAASVLREAALVEESAGNLDSAEMLIKRALERHPGDRSAIAVQARLLSRRGQDYPLVSLFEKNPEMLDDPSVAVIVGNAQRRLGKKEDARRSFLRALAVTPGDVSLLESLYTLDRELGRNDEAVELSRRLLKRAITEDAKAIGEKRLAETFAVSSTRDEAISHYLTYLKMRPNDTETAERFLTFAREINRPRDGISYLESRYNAETEPKTRRQIAERLGKYLDLELSQPPLAAEWYAKALSQDPLGAECGTRLVYLWKGKGEERRLLALLEGMHLVLSDSLRADHGRWEIYKKLAEVFGWRGNRARYRTIIDLAHIVKLEEELPPVSALLSPLTPPSRSLTEEELKQLVPQARPVRDLLIATREILPKVFPRSASDYDLGRRDRLREGVGAERRREVELLAGRFNLKISEAYSGGDASRCTVFQSGTELIVLVGANLLHKPLSLEVYFELGRAFTMAYWGLLPLLDADAAGIESIVRGMTWCADEKLRERDKNLPPNMGRIAKAVYDAMPRKLRQGLGEQFGALARVFPKDLNEVARDLLFEADRGGLISAGSLLSAMKSVSEPPPGRAEEALRALLSQPRAFALLQYALSKEYEELALTLSAI